MSADAVFRPAGRMNSQRLPDDWGKINLPALQAMHSEAFHAVQVRTIDFN
ncbi:MAG: hypothetical protein ACHQF0_10075 [Chitinophagales bacterium]